MPHELPVLNDRTRPRRLAFASLPDVPLSYPREYQSGSSIIDRSFGNSSTFFSGLSSAALSLPSARPASTSTLASSCELDACSLGLSFGGGATHERKCSP